MESSVGANNSATSGDLEFALARVELVDYYSLAEKAKESSHLKKHLKKHKNPLNGWTGSWPNTKYPSTYSTRNMLSGTR